MTIDEIKKFLGQAYYLDKRVEVLKDELETLESRLQKCTASYTTTITMGGSRQSFEMTLDKVLKYRDMLSYELSCLVDRKKEIESAIKRLDDDRQKIILYKRYINFQTFETISLDIGLEVRQVYRLHKKALQNLSKIL